MRTIWNPWHGCKKCSEGCENCYMYFLDRKRGRDGSEIYRTKSAFDYPISRNRQGQYIVPSGSMLWVCMTSDFFLEEADPWREEAWDIMRERSDVVFYLLTKRPERVKQCLPKDFGDGWENIFFHVTCENQRRADERIPILLSLPFRHKGIICAPFIGPVSIDPYLATGQIEEVSCGGENYDGARVCDFEWVKQLQHQCVAHDVSFCFMETGTVFRKDGKIYRIPDKRTQSLMSHRSGMNYNGKPITFHLTDRMGIDVPVVSYHRRHFRDTCRECGSRPICSGCSECGKCKGE